MPANRTRTPWYGNERARRRFERGVRACHPGLTVSGHSRSRDVDVIYRLRVDLAEYEPREVTIRLTNSSHPDLKTVTADGPTESPHRYEDKSLCLHYKWDPVSRRWVASDGLLALIKLTRRHLFREAHWRETGEPWLGPDTHGPPTDSRRRLPPPRQSR